MHLQPNGDDKELRNCSLVQFFVVHGLAKLNEPLLGSPTLLDAFPHIFTARCELATFGSLLAVVLLCGAK